MHFINIICIADDEHSVEVISKNVVKYSLTNKINRRTAVVLAKNINGIWFVIQHGAVVEQNLPPEFAMVATYCVDKYIELDGENKKKICMDIKKITDQDLNLEEQRQTNAFVGKNWR